MMPYGRHVAAGFIEGIVVDHLHVLGSDAEHGHEDPWLRRGDACRACHRWASDSPSA